MLTVGFIAWLLSIVRTLLLCVAHPGSTWSWMGCVWPAGPFQP